MNSERYNEIALLFNECVELEHEERERLLASRCAHDPELLEQVRALLAHDLETTRAGGSVFRDIIDTVLDAEHSQDNLPERIGDFRIVRMLGRGGMGVVYEAEQIEPARRVALKVIRQSPDRELAELMKREADLLARIEAPGVARVYESGYADHAGVSVPYIAMEMIEGEPIDTFVLERDLTMSQRITLLADTATALQNAHNSGVIHRDIKPANILVQSDSAGVPRPTIVDFGIAGEIRDGDTVTRHMTERSGIVGTLAYMSPEQIGDRPVRADARSDVYSLGSIAFLLLSGRPMHDLTGLSFVAAIRVRTNQNTPRLSSICPRLKGDIDVVVTKATAEDPAWRYETAAAFAADLRRVVSGHAIEARRSSAAYQIKRFVSRNRVGVAAALGVALLVAAVSGYAIRERQRSAIEADTSQFISEYLQNAVLTTSPNEAGKDVTVREVIEANEAEIDERFAERPMVEANLRMVLGLVFRSLGDEVASLRNYQRAADLYIQELGSNARKTLYARGRVGVALRNNNRVDEAIQLFEDVLERQRRTFGELDDDALITMNSLSVAYNRNDQQEQAIEIQEQLLEVRLRRGDSREFLATIMHNLGLSYTVTGRPQEAVEMLIRAEDEYQALGNRTAALISRHLQGRTHNQLEQYETAELLLREGLAIAEEILPSDHYLIRLFWVTLGEACIGLGRYDEARSLLERSLLPSESDEIFPTADRARGMLERLDSLPVVSP
ncbi:MAG: tetratricopeptide repeat protein [Phycisphaerales bacterium]